MGPIQYLFLTIAAVITIIGIARKYNNELGNSIIFMFTIAMLGLIQTRLSGQFENALSIFTSALNLQPNDLQALFYLGIFTAVVIASYTGVTFAFSAAPRKDFWGGLFTVMVALFNGWLVAGTLWYYANYFDYPFVDVQRPLSDVATSIVNFLLPQTIFSGGEAVSAMNAAGTAVVSQPAPANTVFWLIPPTVLMILRIRG